MKKLLLLWALLNLTLFAAEGAIKGDIRVSVAPHEKLYTSEKVVVNLELLSTAFSITDGQIGLENTADYIVQSPKSAGYLQTIEVDGEEWQKVHYEYALYPLRSGTLEIKPFKISFYASMGYGQEKKHFTFTTEPLQLRVDAQTGVKKGSFVLSTEDYRVTSTLKPEKQKLIVGNALEFTVTQKAKGVPDILLPAVHYRSSPLLRVYDKEPLLKDELKGDDDVSRTDRFTFVAMQEGNITLEARTLLWWDTTEEKIKRARIPAISLEIITDPQIAIDTQRSKRNKTMILLASAAVVFLLLFYFLSPQIKSYIKKRGQAYEESEAGRYKALIKSVEKEDISKIYAHFYDWLNSIDSSQRLSSFKEIETHYPQFQKSLHSFEEALISKERFSKKEYLLFLKDLRNTLVLQHRNKSAGLIEDLNP